MASGALVPTIASRAWAGGNDVDSHDVSARDHLRIDRIGLQLYTVRKSMAKDIDGTIAAVAKAGVREVEFAGYFNRSGAQWKALLAQHGLTAPSTHIGFPATNEEWKPQFDIANAIGHRWVVVPWVGNEFRGSTDAFKRLADRLNESGKLAKAAGLRMAYHNHDFEFAPIGNTNGYEVMMGALDPSLVDLELDLYWAVKAGQDPLAMFNRWPGRFQMCHLKDGGPAPARTMTEVGSGTINFDAMLSQAKKAGFKHWFIEHDEPSDDLASVIKSSSYLSKLAPGGKAVVDTLP
jgi:sugar phosphate isomerase/epimerase